MIQEEWTNPDTYTWGRTMMNGGIEIEKQDWMKYGSEIVVAATRAVAAMVAVINSNNNVCNIRWRNPE